MYNDLYKKEKDLHSEVGFREVVAKITSPSQSPLFFVFWWKYPGWGLNVLNSQNDLKGAIHWKFSKEKILEDFITNHINSKNNRP